VIKDSEFNLSSMYGEGPMVGGDTPSGVDRGDANFASTWQKNVAPWANLGAGLLGAISELRSAENDYKLTKIQGKMADSELKMALLSEMTAARERSKLRREKLDRSLSERAVKTAVSGLAQEGSAIAGIAQDYERQAEDERAARLNLKSRSKSMRSQVEARKATAKSRAKQSLLQAKTDFLTDQQSGLPGLIRGLPL